MTFLDQLRHSRQSKATAYDWFIRQYPKHPDGVFVFVEGHEDKSFYTGFIARYVAVEEDIHSSVCGGKDEVYRVHARIMQRPEAQTAILLFFVDKDLSDILGEDRPQATNIYVTDHYAIENYLVTETMLRRVWEEVLHLETLEFSLFQEKFRQELHRFHAVMLPFMAWIVFLRRNSLRPNVNNINLDNFHCFTEELTLVETQELQHTQLIALLERQCNVNTPSDYQTSKDALIQELSAYEPKQYVRGKFELWFFLKFMGGLLDVLRNDLGERVSVFTQINKNNAVEILAPRLSIPQSLKYFLERNINQ
jgi:hypothetical protein